MEFSTKKIFIYCGYFYSERPYCILNSQQMIYDCLTSFIVEDKSLPVFSVNQILSTSKLLIILWILKHGGVLPSFVKHLNQ